MLPLIISMFLSSFPASFAQMLPAEREETEEISEKCVPIQQVALLRNLNVPVDPCTFKPLKKSTLKKVQAVVIAAHPDDETVGMAGWIADQHLTNKKIVVEMMTDGLGSGAQGYLWNAGFQLSDLQFGNARLREYVLSMRALGVTGIRYNKAISMHLKKEEVLPVIEYWKQNSNYEVQFNVDATGNHDSSDHPDHRAIGEALQIADVKAEQKLWSLIYAFRFSARNSLWPASQIYNPSREACELKRVALKKFAIHRPNIGLFAIGWTNSTPDIFVVSYDDCREYHVIANQPSFAWPLPKPIKPAVILEEEDEDKNEDSKSKRGPVKREPEPKVNMKQWKAVFGKIKESFQEESRWQTKNP